MVSRGTPMAREMIPVDVTHTPEVLRLAEEVARTGSPRVLRRDSEDLAVLSPVAPTSKRRKRRVKTKADYEAFLASAGSWKGLVDVEKLHKDLEESRRLTRPPVEL
jgi:hypothetical protein